MKAVFTLIFAFCASISVAQDYAFKVLANKGVNQVKAGTQWVALKTGATLRSEDELKLGEGSYVGLVHSSGKPLEVKTSGNYAVANLESQVQKGSGILTKYTDFILSSNSSEAKKNNLSATGAVDRGQHFAIKLAIPDHSGIFHNVAHIGWRGDDIKAPYIVTVVNMFEDELAVYETRQDNLQLDLNDTKFAGENAVLVTVRSKADSRQISKVHMIKRLGATEQAGIQKSLAEINGDIQAKTALNSFILAGFYEQNKLYIDAIGAYEDAISLAPDVTAYQESFDAFLQRNGLK